TWPLMDGDFIPSGLLSMTPWWVNISENITTVQFNHRMTAYALLAMVVWHTWVIWRSADDERVITSALIVLAGVTLQASLGIWTLLAAGQAGHIPIGHGLVHQGGAAVVLALTVWHIHRLYRAVA
ncbi:MAG: COX15/CtaA family protein, partial [Pseudomonadota bacterium]